MVRKKRKNQKTKKTWCHQHDSHNGIYSLVDVAAHQTRAHIFQVIRYFEYKLNNLNQIHGHYSEMNKSVYFLQSKNIHQMQNDLMQSKPYFFFKGITNLYLLRCFFIFMWIIEYLSVRFDVWCKSNACTLYWYSLISIFGHQFVARKRAVLFSCKPIQIHLLQYDIHALAKWMQMSYRVLCQVHLFMHAASISIAMLTDLSDTFAWKSWGQP